MAKYEHFEDLPVWQEAARLYNAVLDVLELPKPPFTASFRNQLDRAALSVSNNIAEGFERSTTHELLSFIAIARGSAGEVRSMLSVVSSRPSVKAYSRDILRIQALAKSCAKQLQAWTKSIEESNVKGKRYLTITARDGRDTARKATDFRQKFLKNLTSTHPLYNTPEARTARGEISKEN